MTLRIVFRRAAKSEFEHAASWYDEQRPGLGEEFIREIDEALAKAAAAPQRHPVVFRDIRRAVVLTVRFTYRESVIRLFGAGYWRKGKRVYDRENQIHRRTTGKAKGGA